MIQGAPFQTCGKDLLHPFTKVVVPDVRITAERSRPVYRPMTIYIYIYIYTVATKPASLLDFLRIINTGVRCVSTLFQKNTVIFFEVWLGTSRHANAGITACQKASEGNQALMLFEDWRNCLMGMAYLQGAYEMGPFFGGKKTIYTNVW